MSPNEFISLSDDVVKKVPLQYCKNYYVKESNRPVNRSQSGYGNKLPTSYLLKLENEGRWRRVYAICWSNCASFYVLVKKERKFVNSLDKNQLNKGD